MADVQTGKGGLLNTWTAGEPLDHRKLNQVIRQVQNMTKGVRPPSQIRANAGAVASLSIQQFIIVDVLGDYLIGAPWNGVQAEDSEIIIAKPYLLRNSETSRGDITFDYVAVDARTATNSDSDTEDQIVLPDYFVDDIIVAANNVTGGTGLQVFGEDVKWIDLNIDGRAWAKFSG